MLFELCILFMHHRSDELTKFNLATIRHHNPGTPVVPIYCRDGNPVDPLPDAVEVPQTWKRGDNWHTADQILREWFRGPHRVDAQRYVLLEHDVYASCSVKEFYQSVWDKDAAGASVMLGGRDHWCWFSHAPFLPREWIPHAAGISPFCGVFLSHTALSELSEMTDYPDGVYCELALPTALHWLGFNLYQVPKAWSMLWMPVDQSREIIDANPAMYHPVRKLEPHRLSNPPATASVVVLPYFGEFGWMVGRHVRWVHELKCAHKVVCCRRGEELLYPSADEFFYDWPEGVPDSQRCEDAWGDDVTCRIVLKQKYPGFLHIRPHYPNPWAWDHAETKVPVVAPAKLPTVDVALCPRYREHGKEKNWTHWEMVAKALRDAGFTIGVVGIESASVKVSADVYAWDHADGATAGTIDILSHCKLMLTTDTGVSVLAAMLDIPMVIFSPPAHYHPWSFVDMMRKASRAPLHQLPDTAWENPDTVCSNALAYLRGDKVADVITGVVTVPTPVEPQPAPDWFNGLGPTLWGKLHTATGVDQKWLDDFTNSIPCGSCRGHWQELISKTPAPLGDDAEFFLWSVSMHNVVNKRLNKKPFPLPHAKARWAREYPMSA